MAVQLIISSVEEHGIPCLGVATDTLPKSAIEGWAGLFGHCEILHEDQRDPDCKHFPSWALGAPFLFFSPKWKTLEWLGLIK